MSYLQLPIIKDFAKEFPNIGVIAGSAALHGYLLSTEDEKPSWEPNDIDIWIPIKGIDELWSCLYSSYNKLSDDIHGNIKNLIIEHPSTLLYKTLRRKVHRFFNENRYRLVENQSLTKNKKKEYPLTHIIAVHTFKSDANAPNIQLIFTAEMPDLYDVVDTFDFDFLKVAYNITTETFIVPENIQNIIRTKHMYALNIHNKCKITNRLAERVKKYESRGFINNSSVLQEQLEILKIRGEEDMLGYRIVI